MKKMVFLAALASTWVILLLPTEAASTKAGLRIVNLEASYATLDLGNPDPVRYRDFLETIRDELSDDECFGVPMLRPPFKINGEEHPLHIIRKIRSSNGKTAVIVLNGNTLDLIGYADKIQPDGHERFFIFSDLPEKYNFPGHLIFNLPYKSSLEQIKSNAAIDIDNLSISRPALDTRLDRIYGDANLSDAGISYKIWQEQAEFLVLVMRMIVGALRFKYIEGTVAAGYENGVLPDNKWTHIENKWEDVSDKIALSDADGKLSGYVTWPVKNVDDIRGDLGVVKHAENGVCAAQPYYLRTWFPLARRYLKGKKA